jgi:hypothetical protein
VATKADFTEDEWKTLQKGLTGAGMLVSASDQDFTDSFGEAHALAKFLAAQHQQSDNVFIRDVAGTHGTGFGFSASAAKVQSETLEALQVSIAILGSKAPDEVGPYQQLVLGLAEAVAEAKGGGVSDKETAAIAQIREALGSA